MQVTTVGIDLAKHVFQVHGITKDGGVVFNRAIRRAQLIQFFTKLEPCLIGMEACGSSHYWARELTKLGHDVRLIPANYVKPYVKRGKSDANDAERVILLRTIPGVGPVTASAIVATVGDAKQFKNGRQFAAWLGLTPPLNLSSGGKERLGRITKMGDRYIRRLLVTGMTARLRQMKVNPDRVDPWASGLLARKPARLATVAMANKTARIVWAVLTKNEYYRPHSA